MHLHSEKSLRGGVLRILVGVIDPLLAVEENLDALALAEDADLVPALRLEDCLTLLGEGGTLFLILLVREKPAAPRFVVETRRPCAGHAVVVLALVAVHTPVAVLRFLLQAPEHHPGVALERVELHLEAEVEVPVRLLGDQEGVAVHVHPGSHDLSALDLELTVPSDLFPAGEILAVCHGNESGFIGAFGECDDGQQCEQ